jgi:hypothetical protein
MSTNRILTSLKLWLGTGEAIIPDNGPCSALGNPDVGNGAITDGGQVPRLDVVKAVDD